MSIRSSISKLTKLYRKGSILYPRTENDFVKFESSSHLYPHPTLNSFRGFNFNVKKGDLLKLDKYSLPLYLTQRRLISPSIIDSISSFVDSFANFKNGISIKDEKKDQVKEIVNEFQLFLKNNGLNEGNLKKKIYCPSKKKKIYVIKESDKKSKEEKKRLGIFSNTKYLRMRFKTLIAKLKMIKKGNFLSKMEQIFNKVKSEDKIERGMKL